MMSKTKKRSQKLRRHSINHFIMVTQRTKEVTIWHVVSQSGPSVWASSLLNAGQVQGQERKDAGVRVVCSGLTEVGLNVGVWVLWYCLSGAGKQSSSIENVEST